MGDPHNNFLHEIFDVGMLGCIIVVPTGMGGLVAPSSPLSLTSHELLVWGTTKNVDPKSLFN